MKPESGGTPEGLPGRAPRSRHDDVDPQSLLDAAVSNIVQALGGRAGLVRLWERVPEQEIASSSYGLSNEAAARLRPLIDSIVPRLSLDSGDSVMAEVDRSALEPIALGEGLRAVALPLRDDGRLVGLLCLLQPSGERAAETLSPSVLQRLAVEQVDVVIQNARLVERLIEEKRWLEAVVRFSADGIMILDAAGRIVGINPALERIIGRTAEEVRGTLCRETLDPRTRPGVALCPDFCPLLAGRTNPDGTLNVELSYRRRDGNRVPVETNYSVIRTPTGQVLGAIVGVRDITARREAEDLQSTFLSVISHELQTPITIIKGYAEFLSDPDVALPEDDVRKKLAIIGEESDRLQKMVENLLTASRLQAGVIELRPEPLDLGWLVERVAQRLQMAHRQRRLVVVPPDDLPPVIADEERIEQVLSNLIENAFKYSPPEGTVTISTRATGTEVIVTVTDEGAGIPEADRERIFERFQRLDSRLVRQLKGAGLGLYVSKAIIEAHRGRIWVEEAPTGGAAFSFSLPRQESAALPVRFRA